MKALFILFVLFICGYAGKPINFHLARSLEKYGFHRALVTKIDIEDTSTVSGCDMLIVESIPKSVYIDRYDLLDSHLNFEFDYVPRFNSDLAKISTELPEYEADPFDFYIYLNRTQIKKRIELNLPVHIRYHEKSREEYVQFNLYQPKLFLKCDSVTFSSTDKTQKLLQCSVDDKTKCVWIEETYHMIDSKVLKTKVPVVTYFLHHLIIFIFSFVLISNSLYIAISIFTKALISSD